MHIRKQEGGSREPDQVLLLFCLQINSLKTNALQVIQYKNSFSEIKKVIFKYIC
jgi:hypothetical protein